MGLLPRRIEVLTGADPQYSFVHILYSISNKKVIDIFSPFKHFVIVFHVLCLLLRGGVE